MNCPRCYAQNALENQHNERIMCIFCGWCVEPVEANMTAQASDAMKRRMDLIR